MKDLATLEFKSSQKIHFLEIFTIDKSFFLKLRLQDLKEYKTSYSSGLINIEDAGLLLTSFDTFKSKKLFLPSSFGKIEYREKSQYKELNSSQAQNVFDCLKTFESEKTIYHGALTSALAYKYSIGKAINANITGFFKIITPEKKSFHVYFGKPVESGSQVRIWVKPSQQIREGHLYCLNKLRELTH
jgi:hypothetical protein